VALLWCVERVTPLLGGCVAVGRKVPVEEAEELFKGTEEGTE
jgi:hypothetical protein